MDLNMDASSRFILAAERLTVSFDGFKAVDDLNLYIEKNEVRAVIGPNGAGKTTVLDLISGRTRGVRGSRSSSRATTSSGCASTRSSGWAWGASSRPLRSTNR